MSPTDAFCSNCGQKYTTGKITLMSFIGAFFNDVFNLNSKIYRSLWALFIPGKLTNEFFKGKHKSFAPPLRIFIVASIVYALGLTAVVKQVKTLNQNFERANKWERVRIVDKLDSLQTNDLIPIQSEQKDTLLRFLKNEIKGHTSTHKTWSNLVRYEPPFHLEDQVQLPHSDIYLLTEEEILKKYKVEGFVNTLIAKQTIHTIKSPEKLLSFIIVRISIILLFMMPLAALILKLLYIRQKKYYVEHLVFSIHSHCFVFLLFGLSLLFFDIKYETSANGSFSISEGAAHIGTLFVVIIYFFMALRRVYRQGRFITFIKFALANLMYLFVFVFFALATLIISILLF